MVNRTAVAFGMGFVLAFAVARADIYVAHRKASGIVPVQSTDVSMDAETVVIERGPDYFEAKARFVMRNQSDTTSANLVAFPVLGSSFPSSTGDISRWFRVRMKREGQDDSAMVPAVVRVERNVRRLAADPDPLFFPEAVVWDVTWAPRETKIIEVNYDVGELTPMAGSSGIAQGWELTYIVRTGALWKGPIGKADISFRFSELDLSHANLSTTYSQTGKWSGPHEIAWHFENWTPTEDIRVRGTYWNGFTPDSERYYRVWLPNPYRGGDVAYTDDTINDWVERELILAKEYYPQAAAALDRRPIRRLFADCLYHELFARHGEAFFLGRRVEGQPEPAGAVGTTGVGLGPQYYMSSWAYRFGFYGGLKGWYRPVYDAEGKSPPITLSPMEQRNAEFLKAYLERIKE